MKIALEGLTFYAYHGYYAHERETGGRYEVDIYIDTNQEQVAQSDKLSDTLNYETIANIALHEMQQPAHLIEHIAKRIADQINQTFCPPDAANNCAIQHLKVRISKFDVPIGITLRRTFVEYDIHNTHLP